MIYNLGVVPDLQISKKVELLMIYMIFFEKKQFFFQSVFEVFFIISLFLELQRLWDHSQIVDHIFLILTKKFSAPETQWAPHW